jgi:hypothetical protein
MITSCQAVADLKAHHIRSTECLSVVPDASSGSSFIKEPVSSLSPERPSFLFRAYLTLIHCITFSTAISFASFNLPLKNPPNNSRSDNCTVISALRTFEPRLDPETPPFQPFPERPIKLS